jgi:hypothetical protein
VRENGYPKSIRGVAEVLSSRMTKPTSHVSIHRYEKNGLPKVSQLPTLAERCGITEAEMTAGYLAEVLLRVVAGRSGVTVEDIEKAVSAKRRAEWGHILAAVERIREEEKMREDGR